VEESGGSVDCVTVDSLVYCAVREAGGEHAFCSSRKPEHVAAARGLPCNFGLYIAFDAGAKCTMLMTQAGTHFHP
jgi:hypothetical protein